MKKILTATILGTLLATAAKADEMTTSPLVSHPEGRFGAGVILGEPTGLSLKYWLNNTMAVDGGFGWSFEHETDLHLQSDILWHKFDLIHVSQGQLPVYFGVGGRWKIRDDDSDRVGVRIPVGLSYIFEKAPVDIFLEVAPVIDLAPSTRGSFTAGIGARYWF